MERYKNIFQCVKKISNQYIIFIHLLTLNLKYYCYTGEWSDQNDNWNKVDDETKRKIGLRYKADGEFWMDYFKDFVHEFEEVSICTMGPDFDHDGQVDNANVSIKIQFHKKNSRIHIQFHEFFLLLSVQ